MSSTPVKEVNEEELIEFFTNDSKLSTYLDQYGHLYTEPFYLGDFLRSIGDMTKVEKLKLVLKTIYQSSRPVGEKVLKELEL